MTDGDVFGYRELGKERWLLIDADNPELSRGVWRKLGQPRAAHGDLAVVRPHCACENLDERGLPRSVLADYRVDLSRVHLERSVPQRLHACVILAQGAGTEQQLTVDHVSGGTRQPDRHPRSRSGRWFGQSPR